jgi:hypothetical protein
MIKIKSELLSYIRFVFIVLRSMPFVVVVILKITLGLNTCRISFHAFGLILVPALLFGSPFSLD